MEISMINKDLELLAWALCLAPDEIDVRDYQSEYVLGIPTQEEIDNLPRKIDLIKIMEETYLQPSWIGCCTAMGISHTILAMEILERNMKDIYVDYKYQWVVNQWKKREKNSGWDFLENAAHTLKKNWVKWKINWKDFVFKIDWYTTEEVGTDFNKFLKNAARHLSNNRPLYWAIRGNAQTWKECNAWEIKTVYPFKWTQGHAIMLWGIDFDRKKVKICNSWSWNSKNEDDRISISSFEISFDVLEKLIKNWVLNFRFWLFYNYIDLPMAKLFDDFVWYEENTEAYKAVEWAKTNGIIKGTPTTNGARLEPNRPATRLEILLILYRILWNK